MALEQPLLCISGCHWPHSCIVQQLRQSRPFAAPFPKRVFSEQNIVPHQRTVHLLSCRVDALAPCIGRLQFAPHVGMNRLLLRLGLSQVNATTRTNHEVRRIEHRQAIFFHIAQPCKGVPVFTDLAKRLDAAVGLRPFDERLFQSSTSRRVRQTLVNALRHWRRCALAHAIKHVANVPAEPQRPQRIRWREA